MKFKFTKLLVFSLILGLVPLFTACNKESDTDSLKSRYETVSQTFKKPFNEGKVKIFGKVTGYSNPSIKMVLAEVIMQIQTYMLRKCLIIRLLMVLNILNTY